MNKCIDYFMEYLPYYYKDSEIVINLMDIFEDEICNNRDYLYDVYKQFIIDTATWGLETYEKELGLPTNLALDYEERRDIIKAKLKGQGTTTVRVIQEIAESFSGGEVEVVEIYDKYRFVISFIGKKGKIPNIEELRSIIDEVKPAHLDYIFKYSYMKWSELEKYTWESLILNSWDDVKNDNIEVVKGERG